jgi:hypothetical protein
MPEPQLPEGGTVARAAFLEAAGQAVDLIADDRVADGWDRPSALEGMTVGAVAVHLSAAVSRIEVFLDAGEPPGTRALPPDRLFVPVSRDLDDPVHQGVRAGSTERAAVGHAALLEQVRGELDVLRHRLPLEPPDRRIRAIFDLDMHLDGYLVSRLVELVVHTDDLAVSVGAEPPAMSDDLARLVVECLVGVARRRHGDLEVVRAFARPHRAPADVLRVF